jgi:parvulin-like peptidyl-prolyl isomerase
METKPIMKRVIVVTLLSLGAAGCAQSRSALSQQDPPGSTAARSKLGPVAVNPVPSLDQTVNRGLGNSAVVRSAIKDPDDPRWTGRAPASATANPNPEGAVAAAPRQSNPQSAEVRDPAPAPDPLAAQAPATTAPSAAPEIAHDAASALPPTGAAPAANAGASPANPALTARPDALADPVSLPAPDSPRATATMSMPTPVPSPAPESNPTLPPGGAVPSEPAGTSMGLPISGPIPVPPEGLQNGAPELPAVPQNALANPPGPLTPGSADDIPPLLGGPSGTLANPSTPLTPASPELAPTRQARKPITDPLLGPNPDLMPPIPDITEARAIPVKKTAQPASAQSAVGRSAALKPQASGSPSPSAIPDAKPPALPELPEPPPAAAGPAAPPADAPAASPAPIELEPAPSPDSGAGVSPTPAENPAGPGGSAALTEPASAGSVAALPPLEPAPPARSSASTFAAQAAPSHSRLPRSDPQVVLASGENIKKQAARSAAPASTAAERRRLALEPGRPVARVGEEIITYHDLLAQARQHRMFPQLKEAYRNGGAADKREALKHLQMLHDATLADLINRSLLAQEARRHITKHKNGATMLNAIYEEADQRFRESEILPLQRKYNLDNEAQVKEKLTELGRSLPEMQQAFRQMCLGEMYLHSTLKDKVKVELPDMLKYYNDHMNRHDFDRPALITWREIVVEPARSAPSKNTKDDTKIPIEGETINRAAARGEAIAILERLRNGEDFATLARKESDGPSASRNNGGLMETSPGGYGVPAVNKALESLRIGQVSDLIEGPDGFHIVKVEKRRPAGPASFEEVQSQIKPLIENEKWVAERNALIAKLRKTNYIKIYAAKSKKSDESKAAKT